MSRLFDFLFVAHLLIFLSNSITILSAEWVNRSEIDRQALLFFRASISDDPIIVLGSWHKNSLNFCSWKGIGCGKALPLRVVSLDLNSLRLTGELSPFLANLTSLERLDLGNNQLSGEIPQEFGTLLQLQSLMLASNQLAGNIPRSLGTATSLRYVNFAYNILSGGIPNSLTNSPTLSVLNLTSNNFSGTIPATLFSRTSALVTVDLQNNLFSGPIPDFHQTGALQFLNLAGNILSGSIPSSLGNVSSLTKIYLNYNSLTGSIPTTLNHIRNLSVLSLSNNNLLGYISEELCNISSLTIFDLGQNRLTGRMPSNIGNLLPNLEILILSGNRIEGLIPASLANASNILLFDLSNNLVVGTVPSLGSLSSLMMLDLENNYLESGNWAFVTALTNCTQLQSVAMGSNYLNGSLPISVGNLSRSLQRLNLGNNQIVGTIPIEIGNLQNLQLLSMNENLLTGEIPYSIENLSQLSHLLLSSNRLTGEILPKIGNFSLLVRLHLGNNNFTGTIPASLGYCKQLIMLNLSNNSLYGPIPSQLSNTSLSLGLDLSHNNLTGSIPTQIGALINLIHLDISYNNLSGEAPLSLGQCVTLQYLNTKRNMLNGSIPHSFRNLQSISLLDLSENNFVGPIPVFFGNFSSLIKLDLSYNNFEGEIPTLGVFQNISATNIDGNKGLCTSTTATTFVFAFPICPRIPVGGTKKNLHFLLIVIPPITIALFSFLCFIVTLLKKRVDSTTLCYKATMKKVSYGDILKATNWFSPVNKINSSHTGSIYIGRFEFDTDHVAIKVFHLDEQGSLSSFLMECEVLRNTRHRNLMKAVTSCSTVDVENKEFKAIVFDFMANGSLDMWVHPKIHQNSSKRSLSLGQMIRIATDVASALNYMHNQLTPCLVHCDLKPANVLLDYDMTARIGDFGSAKFLSSGISSAEGCVGTGGTIGYIAPEYGMGYKISTGCDVYSFGVLLLEMLTGKRPTDAMFSDGTSLRKLVSSAFPNGLCEVLHPYMAQVGHHACATFVMQSYLAPIVEIGLLCSMELPKDRPGMQDVCAKMFAINQAFLES